MDKTDYITGEVYFYFVFFDLNFKFPELIPLVYIGKNIENLGSVDEWFFQEVESYCLEGAFQGTTNFTDKEITNFMNNPPKLYVFTKHQLMTVYTLDKLITKLQLWREEPDGRKWID